MTVDKQPRALYLADVLAAGFECDQEWYEIESAKELRRLHAENEDFRATCDYLTRENAEHIGEIVALREQRDELREALKEAAKFLEMAFNHDGDVFGIDRNDATDALSAAYVAIAKATGETK